MLSFFPIKWMSVLQCSGVPLPKKSKTKHLCCPLTVIAKKDNNNNKSRKVYLGDFRTALGEKQLCSLTALLLSSISSAAGQWGPTTSHISFHKVFNFLIFGCDLKDLTLVLTKLNVVPGIKPPAFLEGDANMQDTECCPLHPFKSWCRRCMEAWHEMASEWRIPRKNKDANL